MNDDYFAEDFDKKVRELAERHAFPYVCNDNWQNVNNGMTYYQWLLGTLAAGMLARHGGNLPAGTVAGYCGAVASAIIREGVSAELRCKWANEKKSSPPLDGEQAGN